MEVNSKINPHRDGIDHINIYSRGKTEVGRQLSNFAYSPFTHIKYGKFNSIEGLWYYLITGGQHEVLRDLYGFKAKKIGRELINQDEWNLVDTENPDFKEDIREGIRQKLREDKKLLKMLCKTEGKPLKHYYVYESKKKFDENGLPEYTIRNAGHSWVIEEIERIRQISLDFIKNKNMNIR
jgi:ATP-dependent protease HslVU (ClpYQ) ATPase subunit